MLHICIHIPSTSSPLPLSLEQHCSVILHTQSSIHCLLSSVAPFLFHGAPFHPDTFTTATTTCSCFLCIFQRIKPSWFLWYMFFLFPKEGKNVTRVFIVLKRKISIFKFHFGKFESNTSSPPPKCRILTELFRLFIKRRTSRRIWSVFNSNFWRRNLS